MFADAVADYRGDGVAEAVPASVLTREAALAASQSDVLFCCVDTLEARQIADLLAAAFLIPLFDVGVVIPARKGNEGVAITDVCGRIDYVQPGRSSLQDRGVYTPESLRAEYLQRAAPEAHRQEREAGYIKGLIEEAPAVITLNMRAAAGMCAMSSSPAPTHFGLSQIIFMPAPNSASRHARRNILRRRSSFRRQILSWVAALLNHSSVCPFSDRHELEFRDEHCNLVAKYLGAHCALSTYTDRGGRQLAQTVTTTRSGTCTRRRRGLVRRDALSLWLWSNHRAAGNPRSDAALGFQR